MNYVSKKATLLIAISIVSLAKHVCVLDAQQRDASEKHAARIERILITDDATHTCGLQLPNLSLFYGKNLSDSNLQELNDKVLAAYHVAGHYLAKIVSVKFEDEKNVQATMMEININAGKRAKLRKISVTGNRIISDAKVAAILDLSSGSTFSEAGMQKSLQRLVSLYADRGHPYAEIKIKKLELDSIGDVIVEIGVREGRGIRIGKIVIAGNAVTRRDTVLKQAKLSEGEAFSLRKMQVAKERLSRSGIYAEVNQINLVADENPYVVNVGISLRERKSNFVSGAAGVSPGGGTNRSTVSGIMNVSFGNLFGTARKFNLSWERRARSVSSLEIGYIEPWLLGTNISTNFVYSQEVRDSTYTQLAIEFGVAYPIMTNLIGQLEYAYERVSPGSETFDQVVPNSKNALEVSIRYSNIEMPRNPKGGNAISLAANVGWRNVDGEKKLEEIVSINGEYYRPTGSKQVLAISMNYENVNTSDEQFPSFLLLPIGGGTSIRGFGEEQFRGDEIGWMNIEYRFLFSGLSRFFVFYDLGFVKIPSLETMERKEEFLEGLGLGMRLETDLGLLGLDYGFVPNGSLANGRIHIRLMEEF